LFDISGSLDGFSSALQNFSLGGLACKEIHPACDVIKNFPVSQFKNSAHPPKK